MSIVTPVLNATEDICEWNIDTSKRNKVLTVGTNFLSVKDVITTVEKESFKTEMLERKREVLKRQPMIGQGYHLFHNASQSAAFEVISVNLFISSQCADVKILNLSLYKPTAKTGYYKKQNQPFSK